MSTYGDESIPLTCPNPKCKKDLSIKISEVVSRGRVRCSRCNSEVILSSSATSNLRSAISEMERAKDKLSRAMSQLMSNAQFNIKT